MDAGLVSSDIPYAEIPTWKSLEDVTEELTTASHSRKTLVIDALDGMERLARTYTCETDYAGDWSEKGFEGFQRGYRTMANGPWKKFLSLLDRLRNERKMWIILLAHTGIGNIRNPRGNDYNTFTPAMHKDAWQITLAWADIVLFANREVYTEKGKSDAKGKVRGVGDRMMATEWDASFDAKNRHNLPPEISMGSDGKEAWANFVNALNHKEQS
jgi:hypothetical protein